MSIQGPKATEADSEQDVESERKAKSALARRMRQETEDRSETDAQIT